MVRGTAGSCSTSLGRFATIATRSRRGGLCPQSPVQCLDPPIARVAGRLRWRRTRNHGVMARDDRPLDTYALCTRWNRYPRLFEAGRCMRNHGGRARDDRPMDHYALCTRWNRYLRLFEASSVPLPLMQTAFGRAGSHTRSR